MARGLGWFGKLAAGLLLEPEQNPGGVVYGVLVTGALIAAEGGQQETYRSVLEASLLALALYWLAHAYARSYGERLGRVEAPLLAQLARAFVHEAALLKGAALPVMALAAARLAGLGLPAGVTVALWAAGIELVVLEGLAGLQRKLPRRELLLEVSVGGLLGAGILGIRVLLH